MFNYSRILSAALLTLALWPVCAQAQIKLGIDFDHGSTIQYEAIDANIRIANETSNP